jgi:hypothetical protein
MATSILNLANCSTQGNAGGTFCNNEPVYFLYAVAIPKGSVIPASALVTQAAFKTYVQTTSLWANSRTNRWQITPKLVDFKDNTKEPNMEDLDGYENTTQWLPYDWTFRFANGFSGATKNVHQTWRQFYNQQQNFYDFLFIDANNLWLGTKALDSTGAQGMGGIPVSNITVNDYKPATPKTSNIYTLRLIIQDNATLNQNFASVQSTTLASTFKALTDVSIIAGTTTTTSMHIFVSGMIGGNTLGKQYGATLAVASAWAVLDAGVAVVPSAVAYDAANDQYNLTIAGSATGDAMSVGLATPSVMTITPFFANIVTEGTNVYSYVSP